MNSNKVQQQLIGEELDGLRTLLPKGFVSINRVRSMERAAAELDGSYGAYRADIARSSEAIRSEEHTSELQSLMRISYAVFCLKKKNKQTTKQYDKNTTQRHKKQKLTS